MKLISFVIGTRPEAIKLAPVIIAFKLNKNISTRIIFSGQHKEMVNQVAELFGLKEDVNLNLMKQGQSLTYVTVCTINGLEEEFKSQTPQLVIVQGDTTTAFSAALAAFYQGIPVAHIEAGLRTNFLMDPFPEEANRRLISQISTLNFAPTKRAYENLKKCGIDEETIEVTGNTVVDFTVRGV